MITHERLEPTLTRAAVSVRLGVTDDGRIIVETTFREHGTEPQVARDVHSIEWSREIANAVVAGQIAGARATSPAPLAEPMSPALAAALAEGSRLRDVIRTGGAMYRAERAILGVPGGIDPAPEPVAAARAVVEAALTTIGDALRGPFARTSDETMIRGYLPDGEGGTSRRYLDANDCRALAAAFGVVADALAAVRKDGAE